MNTTSAAAAPPPAAPAPAPTSDAAAVPRIPFASRTDLAVFKAQIAQLAADAVAGAKDHLLAELRAEWAEVRAAERAERRAALAAARGGSGAPEDDDGDDDEGDDIEQVIDENRAWATVEKTIKERYLAEIEAVVHANAAIAGVPYAQCEEIAPIDVALHERVRQAEQVRDELMRELARMRRLVPALMYSLDLDTTAPDAPAEVPKPVRLPEPESVLQDVSAHHALADARDELGLPCAPALWMLLLA